MPRDFVTLPKVGEVVYAVQDGLNVPGQMAYLEHTQSMFARDVSKAIYELSEKLANPELEDFIGGEWVPYHDPARALDVVVYEIRRIR